MVVPTPIVCVRGIELYSYRPSVAPMYADRIIRIACRDEARASGMAERRADSEGRIDVLQAGMGQAVRLWYDLFGTLPFRDECHAHLVLGMGRYHHIGVRTSPFSPNATGKSHEATDPGRWSYCYHPIKAARIRQYKRQWSGPSTGPLYILSVHVRTCVPEQVAQKDVSLTY
jgi:hypothetical protein